MTGRSHTREDEGPSLRGVTRWGYMMPVITLVNELAFELLLVVAIAYGLLLALLETWAERRGLVNLDAHSNATSTLIVYGGFVALTILFWSLLGAFKGSIGPHVSDGVERAVVLVALIAAFDILRRRLPKPFG